ncbi:MAG: metallophosphoesterase [Bifidobacteriaceae bacterium]|nr:metallophosphoesterase [Bifidobacteriaceae bacterium]
MRKGALAVCAIGGVGVAYALAEAQSYVLRRVTVPVLPPDAEPLRVLHLSDLHLACTPAGARLAAWVRELAAERPDFVALTGDNFSRANGLPVILDALAPLTGLPGAFVFGSNDYLSARPKNPAHYLLTRLRPHPGPERNMRDGHVRPGSGAGGERQRAVADGLARYANWHGDEREFDLPWTALRDALVRAGWFDLNNARANLQLGTIQVRLVGLDDPHIDRDNLPPPPGPEAGGLVIGLVHAPYRRALCALSDDGADLILAGHTHGGQLALPIHGALVVNCDVGTSRSRGLHGWPGPRPDQPGGAESVWLHISAGLGTSPYVPLRFAARPEATLLTLTPRPKPEA